MTAEDNVKRLGVGSTLSEQFGYTPEPRKINE